MTRTLAAAVLLATLAAAPARAASPYLEAFVSDISPERQAAMRDAVSVVVVQPWTPIVDGVAAVIRRKLPADQADAAVANLKSSYAERVATAGDRTPKEPRGFTTVIDGRVYSFLGEENLTAEGEWDRTGSRSRRIAVHELAHAMFLAGMSGAEHAELKRLWIGYQSRTPGGYQYKDGDENEGWAEIVEVHFDRHQQGENKAGFSPFDGAFVKLKPLMDFAARLLGPARRY